MASYSYTIEFIGLCWTSQHLEHIRILIRNRYAKIGAEDSEPYRLATLLHDLIKRNNPDFLMRSTLQQWAKHVDLAIRVDGRNPEQIEKVIRWCQGHEFWWNKVLSTEKLRKQYDRLCGEMNGKKGARNHDFSHKQYKGTDPAEIPWLADD